MISVKITGDKELDRMLRNLNQLPQKELKKAVRLSARPIVKAARKGIKKHNKSRNLTKSIGIINGRNKKMPTVYVGPRVKRNHKGYHGWLLELGWSSFDGVRYMEKGYLAGKTEAQNSLQANLLKVLRKQENK